MTRTKSNKIKRVTNTNNNNEKYREEEEIRKAETFRRLISRHLKKGTMPTLAVLIAKAVSMGLGEKTARRIINKFKTLNMYSAVSSRPELRQRYHRGNAFPSLGHVQIDFAVFHPEWRGFNDRNIGFILGVDQLSLRLTVLPTKSKSTKDWLKMVEELVRRDPLQTKVITDRDAAVTTTKFRKEIKDKYNVSWEVLHNRNKAYLAEIMIRHVKRLLSIYLGSNSTKRWVDFVEPLVKQHNSIPVSDTGYAPKQVDWNNYEDFTIKLTKDPDFFHTLNSTLFRNSPPEAHDLFKFDLGDRVRVDRRYHPNRSERRKVFDKPSVEGSYGEEIFRIRNRGFTYISKRRGYLRIYTIGYERGQRIPGTFYERELKLVSEMQQDN